MVRPTEKVVGSIAIHMNKKRKGASDGVDVFEGVHGGRPVAVKRIGYDLLENISIEITQEVVWDYENVACYFAREDDVDFTYIVMELCIGKLENLFEAEERGITMSEALCQMASGLHELHSRGYVHGNLKPRNVLIAKLADGRMVVKLTDFQCRRRGSPESSATTDCWPQAPETFELSNFDATSDVFALGCVFCYLLTKGYHPFGEPSVRFDNIRNGRIDKLALEKIDDVAIRQLVKSMIGSDPKSRPCIREILNNPVIAIERSTAQLRSLSLSHAASRIPRKGKPIGDSASVGVEVYEALVEKQLRAIKKINVRDYQTNYRRELDIITTPNMSNCPYLVRYFSHEEDEKGTFCYIEMERCIASLKYYIESKEFTSKVNDRPTRRLFQKNIVEGVKFLHGIGLIHRDIKPSNVLICDDLGVLIPKISDYGISELAKNDGFQSTTSHRGTDGWRAPEINSLHQYSKAVDCFALGCLLFYIETEVGHPFNKPKSAYIGSETQRNIDKYQPCLNSISPVEPTIQDLICKALERDSIDRPNTAQMLSHPAFMTNEEALGFIRDSVDLNPAIAGLDATFEQCYPGLVNIVIGDDDWWSRLETPVREEAKIGQNRKKIKNVDSPKYGTSILNLIKLIRNKYAHFTEINKGVREIIGEPPNKYYEYWNKKFPHLLVAIWNVTKRLKLSKLTLEIHRERTAKFPAKEITQQGILAEGKQLVKTLFTDRSANRKTNKVEYSRRNQWSEISKKSYSEFLTDFPLEVLGRLGASHHLDNTKKEIIYRLRHRLDIGVDDASAPIDEDHNKRSTYETLLELIDDYDPSAICEIFQLLLESRFTAPLSNPITNESYLALFDDIHLSAVPNEPPINLGCDTGLSRVVLTSCRSAAMSQSLELLKELFNLDTLHRNDLFDKSLTNHPQTIDIGVGFMGNKEEQHHVLVVHIVGDFREALDFVKDFADVLLIEDTPSSGEKTKSLKKMCGDDGSWNSQNMLTLVWKPGNTKNKPYETNKALFQRMEMQYGSRLVGTLASKVMCHFKNRRLERKGISKLLILEKRLRAIDYPSLNVGDELEPLLCDGVRVTRASLKLQCNFCKQAKHEEKRREDRLDEDSSKLCDQAISECIEWRERRATSVGKIPLLVHFKDMLCVKDQGKRATAVRRLEQYLSRISETELQKLQDQIDQYHAHLLRFGPRGHEGDEGSQHVKQMYLEAKINYRESMLHIEYLWRELSHLFVADPILYEDVPRLAAQHLLDGFSLELLDGDANLLNLPWIQSVFSNLSQLMDPKKRRLFVLSVMGVQSSGKSTLLNALFGIKMKTSVGQCTRGINMQLVPVSDRDEYDYVLILDTEGMRSPDYHGMEGNEKRDNQMATLSILLADATVVVNPGENDTAIREVLPIVLMAYSRSKLAEESHSRLSSMLFFVYNRIDTMQREKLSNIVQTLNYSLAEAFNIVGPSLGSKRCLFGDFHLDASNSSKSDVRILGNNKKSFTPPNNVPDPAYGAVLAEFREHIHRRVVEKRREWKSHSPNELSMYLGKIWECICSADFSIKFRNVLEIMAFDEVEAEYQEIERKLVSRYQKRFSDVQQSLEKEAAVTEPTLDPNSTTLHESLQLRLKTAMSSVVSNLDKCFLQAVNKNGREQWRPTYDQRWELSKQKQEDYWCRQLRHSYDANILYDFQLEELKNDMRRKISAEIADKGHSLLTESELYSEFKILMEKFVCKAKTNYPPLDVTQCVNNFYATSAIVRRQHISLKSSDLETALNKVSNLKEHRQLESNFLVCLSSHWPDTSRHVFERMSTCLRTIQDAIDRRLETIRCYDDGVVSSVIKDTSDAVTAESANIKIVLNSHRELAHAFARTYLIFRMERIQKTWEARNLVWAKFDRKTNWTAMWNYFRMASRGAANIKLFTLLISSKFENLQKAYKVEVAALALRDLKKRLGNTHWAPAYMDRQLVYVVQSHQLPLLFRYARNPNELQVHVLRQMLDHIVHHTMSRVKTWRQFVTSLSKCVSRATGIALMDGRRSRARRFVNSLRTMMARNLASNSITKSLDHNLSANFDQLDNLEKSEIRKECEQVLKKLVHGQRDPCEAIYDFAEQVTSVAINQLRERGGLSLRCKRCCPCCGAMCVREAGHSGLRHVTKHQPAGLVGWTLHNGTLDWRTCYDFKPEDQLVRESRRFVFREWSTVFPEWERPSGRLNGNRNVLQEFIFYNYHHQFARFYNVKPCASVPLGYNRNWDSVIGEIHSAEPPFNTF